MDARKKSSLCDVRLVNRCDWLIVGVGGQDITRLEKKKKGGKGGKRWGKGGKKDEKEKEKERGVVALFASRVVSCCSASSPLVTRPI